MDSEHHATIRGQESGRSIGNRRITTSSEVPVLLLRFPSGAHSSYLSWAVLDYRPRFPSGPESPPCFQAGTTIKKKEPPKDDSPNRRRSSAPISASLFRYYSASPNASVIRMDLLDLTIADAGITLDLDKDWHPDLYVKCDTKR